MLRTSKALPLLSAAASDNSSMKLGDQAEQVVLQFHSVPLACQTGSNSRPEVELPADPEAGLGCAGPR
jgi:hypothetical protein